DALVLPQDLVVVVDDPQQNLGRDVFHVGLRDKPAAGLCNVLDHMVDQSHVAVHEVVPGTRLAPQTSVDQFAINLAQRHGDASCTGGSQGTSDHIVHVASQTFAIIVTRATRQAICGENPFQG